MLAEFGERTFVENFAAQNTPENMSVYLAGAFNPDKQAAELADPGSVFLLAEVEGELAGYAHLHAGPPTLETLDQTGIDSDARDAIELVRIYADTPWIGKGVGPALMQACLDESRSRGFELIWLGVWEHNPRAQVFYRKWGFEKIGTHIFMLGADPQTDWIMAREIK
ncbi:MAG TPA: GNAT family N-acetyltransferase [Anaerolineales bacterium]|nr:GNAT family N-acetyltransferase [Anaerolineales bacterium]